MSIEWVKYALSHSPATKPRTRLVHVVLAEAANDVDGRCWPGIKAIAAKAGTSRRRSITDALTELEQLGAIRREVCNAEFRTNTYQLLKPKTLSESDTLPESDPVGKRRVTLSENDANPVGKRRVTLSESDTQTGREPEEPEENRKCACARNEHRIENHLEDLRAQFPTLNVEDHIDNFRDNRKAKGLKPPKDEVAAYRIWLRREEKFHANNPRRSGPATTPSEASEFAIFD